MVNYIEKIYNSTKSFKMIVKNELKNSLLENHFFSFYGKTKDIKKIFWIIY